MLILALSFHFNSLEFLFYICRRYTCWISTKRDIVKLHKKVVDLKSVQEIKSASFTVSLICLSWKYHFCYVFEKWSFLFQAMPKSSHGGVLKTKYFFKFPRIYRKTPVSEFKLHEERLWHRCFAVNFAKFLRTPIVTKNLWGTASKCH